MKAVLPPAEATRTQNRTTRGCLAVILFLYLTAVLNMVRPLLPGSTTACPLLLPTTVAHLPGGSSATCAVPPQNCPCCVYCY